MIKTYEEFLTNLRSDGEKKLELFYKLLIESTNRIENITKQILENGL